VEKNSGSDDKAEIVPEAAIMNFIDTNISGEDGDDESEGRDKSVPQSFPEASNFPLLVRSFFEFIWSGHTRRDKKDKDYGQSYNGNYSHNTSDFVEYSLVRDIFPHHFHISKLSHLGFISSISF